jgi:hypothetical protein
VRRRVVGGRKSVSLVVYMLSGWMGVRESVRVCESTGERSSKRRVHQGRTGPEREIKRDLIGLKHRTVLSTLLHKRYGKGLIRETDSRYVQGMTGECTYTAFGVKKKERRKHAQGSPTHIH